MRVLNSAALAGIVLSLSLWVGCDSNDPTADLADIVGDYRVTTFTFVPQSQNLTSVNLLDTLVAGSTRLQVFSSGRYSLLYQFQGAAAQFVGGQASIDGLGVILNGERADEGRYTSLLLTTRTRLDFDPASADVLSADLVRRVNLEAFSNRYRGLPAVDGTIRLRLRPE